MEQRWRQHLLGIGAGLLGALVAIVALRTSERVAMGNDRGIEMLVRDGVVVRNGRGSGSRRWLERREVPTEVAVARGLQLDEDPQRYFERIPPPPVDWMVVLARLQAREIRAIGMGFPLAWESPDELALEALQRVLDEFDRAVLGCALKDGSLPTPVPRPFLRASVPLDRIRGDASRLPIVSGVAGAAPDWQGERVWAGFLNLATEQTSDDQAYLLARWADRVVLALPLAVEVARLGLDPARDLRIVVGHEIGLGARGPRIAIDRRGRVRLPETAPAAGLVPAWAMIAETVPPPSFDATVPWYAVDERLLAGPVARQFARDLPRLDRAIRAAPRPWRRRDLAPSPWAVELVIMAGVAGLGGAAMGRTGWWRWGLVSLGGGLAGTVVLALMLAAGWSVLEPLSWLGGWTGLSIAGAMPRRAQRARPVAAGP